MGHVKGAVLFEHACGWLRTERVMRPAVSAVERIIASAVVEENRVRKLTTVTAPERLRC